MFPSTISISSSSFDQIITDYYSKASITIISDIGIKMTVNIEINQKSNIATHIHFYYNNVEIHYRRLDARLLSLLVDAYHKYISTKLSNGHVSILSLSRLKDIKSLGKLFRNILKISKGLERYRDLRAVNIFTFDKFQNKILARTTIELDADIITIINPELLNTTSVDIFMNLHRANVRLANYLFLYPLTKSFAAIKTIKNIARIISIPLWIIIFNSAILPSKIISNDYNYLFMIFSFIGIPAILYNFIPKIMAFIIRRELM